MQEYEKVRPILKEWTEQLVVSGYFKNAYIFGSIINRGGVAFISNGALESDIDLVVRFAEDDPDIKNRLEALEVLQTSIPQLEMNLLKAFTRGDATEPITSVIPVTGYELYHSIHKGNDVKLFFSKQFIDLASNSTEKIPLSNYIDSKLLIDYLEQINVIRFCQNFRNLYVKCAPNGSRFVSNYDDDDPLPKEIMRYAATLNYCINKVETDLRVDLLEGLKFADQMILTKTENDASFIPLYDLISVRRGGRGKIGPITPTNYLMITELLFDTAREAIPKTLRETLDNTF